MKILGKKVLCIFVTCIHIYDKFGTVDVDNIVHSLYNIIKQISGGKHGGY